MQGAATAAAAASAGTLSDGQEARLRRLYETLDVDGDGKVNVRDLTLALKARKPRTPDAHAYAMHVMEEASGVHGQSISFADFVRYVVRHEKRLTLMFDDCDRNRDGVLDWQEVMHYLSDFGIPVTADQARDIVRKYRLPMIHQPSMQKSALSLLCILRTASRHAGGIELDDFLNYFIFYPSTCAGGMANQWRHNLVLDIGEDAIVPEEFTAKEYQLGAWWQHLVAGAAAGSISRTSTAPLDRVKVFLQVHASVRNDVRLLSGLRMLLKEGGLKGMWRGNGVNVLKIAPESAIKFMIYEQAKKLLKSNRSSGELTMFERLLAGSVAGSIAQTLIYPIEVLKIRLALRRTGEMDQGIIHAFASIHRLEGWRAFYRGFLPNLLGIIPYAGIDLAVYETLKAKYVQHHAGNSEPPPLVLMACGTTSSICGQIASYPLALVRTRLQANVLIGEVIDLAKSMHYQGQTMTEQFTYIIQNEGFTGLYRGLTPNFLKVLPSVCVSYVVYETVRKQLGATMT